MVGRGAQGNPWIFREIDHFLRHGERLAPPSDQARAEVLRAHLAALHEFYGEHQGVRIARKHVGWYLSGDKRLDKTLCRDLRARFNGLDTADAQHRFIDECFHHDPIARPGRVIRNVISEGTCAA